MMADLVNMMLKWDRLADQFKLNRRYSRSALDLYFSQR